MTINILQNYPNCVQISPSPSQLTGRKNNILMYLKVFQVGVPRRAAEINTEKGEPSQIPAFTFTLAEFSIVFLTTLAIWRFL